MYRPATRTGACFAEGKLCDSMLNGSLFCRVLF
jgi:hypothetical protein